MKSDLLAIKKTKTGRGLFAKKAFRKNQRILQLKGKFVNADKQFTKSGPSKDNTFRYGPNTYLYPKGELGEFFNHSCKPNSRIDKIGRKLWIIAIDPIKKGQEVTFDYSTTLAIDDIWTMRCHCGEKNCRKLIRRFASLPKALQQDYKDRGIVPAYILAINYSYK